MIEINNETIFNSINMLYLMGTLVAIGFLLAYIATKVSEPKKAKR